MSELGKMIMINGVVVNPAHVGSIQPASIGKGELTKFTLQVKNHAHHIIYNFPYDNLEDFINDYSDVCRSLGIFDINKFRILTAKLLENAKEIEKKPESKG